MWFLADFETVEALRATIKIILILVSLDLMKVFISQKSLGFSKSCRQRAIFAVLVFFSPEFAIYLSISAQVNNGLFASAVPHPNDPSVGKAIFFVLSEGADEFGVFGSKAFSRPFVSCIGKI